MPLNTEQQAAVAWSLDQLQRQQSPFHTLSGPGGTGKTYTVMAVVEALLADGCRVVMTAPTNKAVKVLKQQAAAYGLDLDRLAFMTVHKVLGLALLPNEDRRSVVRAGRELLELYDVMVADEGSMLSRYALYDYLVPGCQRYQVRALIMGDDLQLPPVKEPLSPVFTEFPRFALEHNVRQGPGPLLDFNQGLRAALRANTDFRGVVGDEPSLTGIQDARFLHAILEAFDTTTDPARQRVLAWTNRRVDQVNGAIRKKLYGADCPPFVPGEQVVTGAPVMRDQELLLGTDEECRVHAVDPDSAVVDPASGVAFATLRVVLEPLDQPGQVVVEVLQAHERARLEAHLDELAQRARGTRRLWGDFWSLKERFADLRHCHCITVHRSQGSTFDRVFVDVKDILKNPNRLERQRLLYVACSRPRHQLLLNKRQFVA